ncbi:MAG TPA: DUF1385 domain-containing protein [Clostridiaceae bacterium]|nr:DUF1385 domain-containing protein [Clostridiaceae bacterium]HBG39392.1 DUF1385 domain-containing protein [Clostridiaceae bacterium]HBN28113.1 DUF1385 domain-containing protein [Clostridiaceae bacterium]
MPKKTSIGGQAVIEGVMMRGPKKIAIAVRKEDGSIEVDVKDSIPFSKRNKFLSLPFIRGIVALFDSLIIGIKSLNFSASFYEDEEEETKFDKYMKEKFKDKADNITTGFSFIISLILATVLFFIIPTLGANLIKRYTESAFIKNLFEGAIRIIIFLLYIYFISKIEDIKRVLEYHGAEHKSIFCYENELPLTPENAKQFTTLHPRCGTNFLFIVMFVSIIVFSFFGWPNITQRIISRILLLPVISGISYEIIRWLGYSDSAVAKVLSYPGLMLQKLTTREPDESQLEVGIAALKAVADDYIMEENRETAVINNEKSKDDLKNENI